MPKYLSFFLLINLLIICLLGWSTYSRVNDFKQQHITLANESVNSLAHEIKIFINERQRLAALFAKEHENLLLNLIQQPENEKHKAALDEKLARYFPQYFSFTIANNRGTPYLVDFDGHVGDLCVADIKRFSLTHENKPQIHPGVDAYHFDIMTPFHNDNIFFISFHADMLGRIIDTIEIHKHRLELVIKNDRALLEANSRGARNKTPRNDYRLTKSEEENILASSPIPNTRWHAIDSHHPELFTNFIYNSLIQNNLFLVISIIISVLFIQLIKKEEARRIFAEKAKNDFLSIVSHELRTPLTSIHGAIALLDNEKIKENPEQSKNMLAIAKRNCSQLLHLINEILDFRKIETGNIEYHFKCIELGILIENAISDINSYAQQYNATINYEKYKTDIYVLADENRIKQVLNNLLSNAIKYGAENDCIEISVTLTTDKVRVSVRDHGKGIPDDFVNQVFDRFTQANIANKQTTGGTGLGLSIAKSFIEGHNGLLDFETSAKGSTFYFELPLYKDKN